MGKQRFAARIGVSFTTVYNWLGYRDPVAAEVIKQGLIVMRDRGRV